VIQVPDSSPRRGGLADPARRRASASQPRDRDAERGAGGVVESGAMRRRCSRRPLALSPPALGLCHLAHARLRDTTRLLRLRGPEPPGLSDYLGFSFHLVRVCRRFDFADLAFPRLRVSEVAVSHQGFTATSSSSTLMEPVLLDHLRRPQ